MSKGLQLMRKLALVVAAMVLLSGCNVAWLQFDGGPDHPGNNGLEGSINQSNVSTLVQAWQATLPHYADGAPMVAFGVSTPSGSRDLVYVTTTAGDLVALDLHTGAKVWSVSFGGGSCKINNTGPACYTTSSPVVDQTGGFVYTYGLDGRVHKVAMGTGVQNTSAPWPVVATRKAFDEKGSSALASATAANGHTYLYAANSGYPGDGGDYQGHITTIDLATGASKVFNTLCSNQTVHFVEQPASPDCPDIQSGVWARPGVTYSSKTDLIYFATGNATYDPTSHDWGGSVLAIHADGTGVNGGPVDSWTPTNYAYLNSSDVDVGSTLPALVTLPTGAKAPDGTALTQVGIQGGKDGMLRLINPANLSGHSGPGHTGGEWDTTDGPGWEILTTPAIWTDSSKTIWVEVGSEFNLAGYTITLNPTTGVPQLNPQWNNSGEATSPLVAGGVLYAAGGNNLNAYDPTTGTLLWSAGVGSIHWQSPVVDDGTVLLEDGSGHLTAWTLPTTPTSSPAANKSHIERYLGSTGPVSVGSARVPADFASQ